MKYSRHTAKQVDRIDSEALRILKAYEWPGNVRELENAIERAVVLSNSRLLRAPDFSFLSAGPAAEFKPRSLRELEKDYVLRILEECDWNVTQASRTLDIHRATLHKMMTRLGLKRP
jgi:two-component system response regulator HydG